MNEKQFRGLIGFATTSWNLSLAPPDKRSALLNDVLRRVIKPGESADDVRHILEAFVARKEALWPDDRRLITDYRVSGGPQDANVVVKYSLP